MFEMEMALATLMVLRDFCDRKVSNLSFGNRHWYLQMCHSLKTELGNSSKVLGSSPNNMLAGPPRKLVSNFSKVILREASCSENQKPIFQEPMPGSTSVQCMFQAV